MRAAIAIVGSILIVIGCLIASLDYMDKAESNDQKWCNDHGYVYYEPGWCAKTLDLVEIK